MAHNRALLAVSIAAILVGACQAGFYDEFYASWGGVNIHPNDTADSVEISLTSDGIGSTFTSNSTYLYGSFSVQAKLVPGNSAGTVAAFFLISPTEDHDEIDFEFLGNASGEPYLLHTNLFANGQGQREQDTYLWFDPTAGYHTYQVVWNQKQVLWLVDSIPIRVHRNVDNVVPDSFPTTRPMVISACIFDASSWATKGGAIPIDYNAAPFNVNFRNFTFDACTTDGEKVGSCASNNGKSWWEATAYQSVNTNWANQLAWVREHYLHYDYCTDPTRTIDYSVECNTNTAIAKAN